MNAHPQLPEHHNNILELHRQGWTQTHIAQALGFSRRTIYNHLHQRVFLPGKRRGRPRGSRKLRPFEVFVKAKWAGGHRVDLAQLLSELRSLGYSGGLSILREYLRSLKS
jgi:transposase